MKRTRCCAVQCRPHTPAQQLSALLPALQLQQAALIRMFLTRGKQGRQAIEAAHCEGRRNERGAGMKNVLAETRGQLHIDQPASRHHSLCNRTVQSEAQLISDMLMACLFVLFLQGTCSHLVRLGGMWLGVTFRQRPTAAKVTRSADHCAHAQHQNQQTQPRPTPAFGLPC